MTAFADNNKDYFRADYNALREELAQIPTNLEGYSKESLDALNTAKEALNYNLNRSKQAELDALVAKLKAARLGLKPAATHSGSLDENELAANVETKPELITRAEKIPFEVIQKENPNLPAKQEKIITPGVDGERTHYISVLTENGKQTETVLDSQVTKEPVTQVVEIGAPITHKGDESGLAPAAEAKPRLDIQEEEIPFTTVTRENPLLFKGKTQVVTKGANGRRSHYYSVSTSADGKEVKTLVDSLVTQEAVAQVIEVGTLVTHVGDENGLAPAAETKPRLDIQEEEIPFTTVTRENPQLPKGQTQVVTKGANGHRTAFYSVSTTADGKEERTLVNSVVTQEAVTQVVEVGTAVEKTEQTEQTAPTTAKADEKQLPATGSQDSAGLVAAGLMATLAAYGLTKRKED